MKANDFIAVRFPQEVNRTYYALVTEILPDDNFKCRFVHSGNNYQFKFYTGWLEVVQTEGNFPVGTRSNKVIHFTESTQLPFDINSIIKVTFSDGNSYLGVVNRLGDPTEVSFLHSGNSYSFDANGIAHKPGSPYDGMEALEMKVYGPGKNLFSGTYEAKISLDIKSRDRALMGEFDIKIMRTDTNHTVYENNSIMTWDNNASIDLNTALAEGQTLNIFVDFHPALEPFIASAIRSTPIDRDTTISGSQTFAYRKIPELHFNVIIENDETTVTATSENEAINTAYTEISTNSSHTFETKFEGEAGIKLFGIGGTVTGGGGTSDTTGSGTVNGGSSSTGTTTGHSTTWTVYYPRGLKISPMFN